MISILNTLAAPAWEPWVLMITEMITEIGHRTVIVTTYVMCDHTSGGGAAAGGRLSAARAAADTRGSGDFYAGPRAAARHTGVSS